MFDASAWWVLPSVAALILVATHTYLGLHVISRNVFFVDLALAQVAALGSTVAYLYGFEIGDSVTYYVSLAFAVLGAWFFSVARVPEDHVPQEAIIGLTFAVASAGAILLSAENPHGAEHLRDMMTGSILVVSHSEVKHAALLYGVIGALHWVFRRQFLRVSLDRDGAAADGMAVQRWDFLFYLSFAVIITSSVRIAGVLLVFILLIAPAVCGAMLATGIRSRLYVGWACGLLATIGGLILSSRMDWPPAPAISCIFAAILIGAAAAVSVARAPRRAHRAAKLAGVATALTASGFALAALLRSELAWSWAHAGEAGSEAHHHGVPEHPIGGSRADLLAALLDEHEQVRASAAKGLGALNDASVVPSLANALRDPSAAVKEKAAEALGVLGRPEATAALSAALASPEEDEWVTLHLAQALVRCGGAAGMSALMSLARDGEAKLVRIEALRTAAAFAGRQLPASLEGAAADAAVADLTAFWRANEPRARWDAGAQRFQFE